jgi:hypothetical protein
MSGNGTANGLLNFMRAYISNGTIARTKPPPRTRSEDIFTGDFLTMFSASDRSATEPRDYIFSTMPQFPWYSYPKTADTMPFSDIFADFEEQARLA